MFTIELTDGPGWDAPTLQARVIKTTVDIEKVSALAADWLQEAQRDASNAHKPDGWRIVDGIGATGENQRNLMPRDALATSRRYRLGYRS